MDSPDPGYRPRGHRLLHLTGQTWARVIGIAVAALSALSNFLFIPYYSLWALVLIALDVAVIWALTTYRPQD